MTIRDFKDDPYLSLLRPLVEAYLAFYRVGNRHIQSLGLTPGQFDVILNWRERRASRVHNCQNIR